MPDLAIAILLCSLAIFGWYGYTLSAGAANKRRRVRELGLEPRFAELDRLCATGALAWHAAKRTQRLELRLAEYEDEISKMQVPPGQVALFEPGNDVEQEALEALTKRNVVQRTPNGKGFVFKP